MLSRLSTRFLLWHLPWRKVFLKGYETRALRTPEALAKFLHECGKNVRAARLARKRTLLLSLHCRCEFGVFPSHARSRAREHRFDYTHLMQVFSFLSGT